MRELTLEEMRMVTGGYSGSENVCTETAGRMRDPLTGQYYYGFDAKGDAAKAIGNFFGDALGALGAIGCAATKGLGKQVGCAVAADRIGEESKPIATAVADGVLRGGGQPGDYACGKLGICR